jgi:hypothetical protein
MGEPKAGERYVHFKGEDWIYEVVALSRDSENPDRRIVVYKQLYSRDDFPIGTVWVRSLEDFCEFVDIPNEKRIKRFRRIE